MPTHLIGKPYKCDKCGERGESFSHCGMAECDVESTFSRVVGAAVWTGGMTMPCKRCDELNDTLALLIESSNQLQRRYLVALDALHEAEKDAQHWKAVVSQRKEAE